MKQTKLKLRASEAHRWMKCSASPHLILKNQDKITRDSSIYADEGTLAHAHAAEALLLGYDEGVFPNTEMASCILDYVLFVQSFKGDLFVEKQIQCFYDKEQRGFVDCIVATDEEIVVIDLKYGAGVSVAAMDNEQLMIYGRSVSEWLASKKYAYPERTRMRLIIFQPRVRGEDAVREWVITLKELVTFTEPMREQADRIHSPGFKGEFSPGEKTCQWCDAKPFCSAYAGYLLKDVPKGASLMKPGGLKTAPVQTLTDEQLKLIVQRAPELSKWIKSIADYIQSRLLAGDRVDGFKLVESKPNRKWTDEDAAFAFLVQHVPEEELLSVGLVSPSQAEKLLQRQKVKGWAEEMAELAIRPPGGPTLAFSEDPRPEWGDLDVAGEFEVLEEETEKPKTKTRKTK